MTTNHALIELDAGSIKDKVNGKVELIVTSPPYWNLKDYGVDGQYGHGQTFNEYIDSLLYSLTSAGNLLKPGCRMCINIGDVYNTSKDLGYHVKSIQAPIIQHLTKNGYGYFGSIVWTKVSTCNPSGGASIMGSYPYPRNGIVKYSHEYILIFKKKGKIKNPNKKIKELSKMTKEEWNSFFYGIWNIPGKKQDKHKAQFPLEVPDRLIKMFSFVGDTVLDPFTGGGTTNIAALKNDRNSIGIDLNVDFLTDALDCLIDYKSVNNKDANTSLIRKSYFDTFKEVKI